MALPLLLLVSFIWRVFIAVRFSSYQWGNLASLADLGDLIADAISLVFQQSDLVAGLEKENYSSRPFILGHLITVMSRLTSQDAQYGKLICISIFNSIPSVIIPGKTTMMLDFDWGADGKAIISKALGFYSEDSAWSPFVAGYSDFMWGAVILYPLFLCGLAWVLARIVRTFRYPIFMIAGMGECFMRFISTETTTATLILVGRTLLFIWVYQRILAHFDHRAGPEIVAEGTG
jgi:hypothetical protein